jgi:C_GCAxxG_C_C family probable redox protein
MKNMQKLKRRRFIGKVGTAIIGSTALGACVRPSENPGDPSGKGSKTHGSTIEENRQMPRALVFQMLDQKVNQYMRISYNCAQSSFLALQEQFGLDGDAIVRALTPLTGIAERGETCGAVTGSLMCFGLIYGRGKERLGDWNAYRASLLPAGDFCSRFEEAYGSTMCSNIQEKTYGRCFRLTDPEELKAFQNSGATEKCSGVVRQAVRMAASIILDGKHPSSV